MLHILTSLNVYALNKSGFQHRKTNDEIKLPNESGVIVCPNPKCHREIEEPILLKSLSKAPEEQYYACPHCFIKLDLGVEKAQPQKEEEKREEEKREKEEPLVKPLEKEGKGPSGCLHHFGYLANRPQNAPIPQECLICSKIVECMLKLSGA